MALEGLGTAVAQGIIEGLLYGSVIGVVAVGLTLIWGVMKVVNLAHGHLVVLGSMLAAFLVLTMGVDPLLLFVAFLVLGAGVGLILYYSAIHKIIGKVDVITLKEEMATLMTTFGFGITIFGLHYLAPDFIEDYSTEPSITYNIAINGKTAVNLGFAVIPNERLIVALIALILAMASYYLVQKTTLGLMIQAVAQDSRALSLVGINPILIKLATTVISTSIAVASGVLVLIYKSSTAPTDEFILAPLSFVIVVLGGLGSILGTYIGGVILGVIYQVVLYTTGIFFGQQQQSIALAVAFAILIIMLLYRPQGLFGKR